MKQWKIITGLVAGTLTPLLGASVAFAAPQLQAPSAAALSSAQTITVTAVVPAHRDIIIDGNGNITEIVSNTKDDVTPVVFLGEDGSEKNKRPLTDEIYDKYRKLVPAGTAKYGILYKQTLPVALTSILNAKS